MFSSGCFIILSFKCKSIICIELILVRGGTSVLRLFFFLACGYQVFLASFVDDVIPLNRNFLTIKKKKENKNQLLLQGLVE